MEQSKQNTLQQHISADQALKQFFESQEIDVPKEFITTFICNYNKRNDYFRSDEVYQIFKSYGNKSRYDIFCQRFIKILSTDNFQEINNSQISGTVNSRYHGLKQKKYYQITYKGYQKIMMKLEDQVQDYFIECESILVKFFEQFINKQQLVISSKSEQIEKLMSLADIIYIYELLIVETGMRYCGNTRNMQTRVHDHLHKSTNKYIREARSVGHTVKVFILARFSAFNRDQIHHVESEFIKLIPKESCCNEVIPEVKLWSNVNAEFKQYTKDLIDNKKQEEFIYRPPRMIQRTQEIVINEEEIKELVPQNTLQNDYSTVNIIEHQVYIDSEEDLEFKQKIQSIKRFIIDHKHYPRESKSNGEQEYSLAQFINKVRNQYKHQNGAYSLSNERYAYIMSLVPDFVFVIDHECDFRAKVQSLAIFIQTNQRYPKCNTEESKELEQSNFLRSVRQLQSKLSSERLQILTFLIPNFIWSQRVQDQIDYIQEVNTFYLLNSRFPMQKENKQLQLFVAKIKKDKDYLLPDVKTFINANLPNLNNALQ